MFAKCVARRGHLVDISVFMRHGTLLLLET